MLGDLKALGGVILGLGLGQKFCCLLIVIAVFGLLLDSCCAMLMYLRLPITDADSLGRTTRLLWTLVLS